MFKDLRVLKEIKATRAILAHKVIKAGRALVTMACRGLREIRDTREQTQDHKDIKVSKERRAIQELTVSRALRVM